MPLAVTITLAAVRTALSAPGTGRHRRARWPRRAARHTAAALRFALGIPDPADRHRATHARRRVAAA